MAGDILNAIVEHEMEAGIIQERLDYPSLQDHPLVVESYRGVTVMSILAKLRTRMYVTLDSSLKLDCLLATCTGSTIERTEVLFAMQEVIARYANEASLHVLV